MALWPLPLWLSVGLDAALAAWVLTRPGWRRVALAGALAGVAWAVKLVALVALGLDAGFGVIHHAYLDVVVALPVGGVALLWSARARRAPLAWAVGVGCLALAPVGVYASYVEPSRLVVERTTVPLAAERAGSEPVRVVVLADLQFTRVGRHERRAVERAMELRPDLVLLPGDVHQGPGRALREEMPEIRGLLGRLRAPGGVFLVHGDAEDVPEAAAVAAGTGVELLVDEVRTVRVRDRRIAIGGIRDEWWLPSAAATIERLESAPGESDVRLLLTHSPDPVLSMSRGTRVDLVVAGHTHGGQVQLPFVGPPITASEVPRDVAAGGLHTLAGGRRVYVSRGVGLERNQAPRVRLGAPPEVSLLTLAG